MGCFRSSARCRPGRRRGHDRSAGCSSKTRSRTCWGSWDLRGQDNLAARATIEKLADATLALAAALPGGRIEIPDAEIPGPRQDPLRIHIVKTEVEVTNRGRCPTRTQGGPGGAAGSLRAHGAGIPFSLRGEPTVRRTDRLAPGRMSPGPQVGSPVSAPG